MSHSAKNYSKGTLKPEPSPQRASATVFVQTIDKASKKEIRVLARNILPLFILFGLVEEERSREILERSKIFIKALDGVKFTDGNNYTKAVSLIPAHGAPLSIATYQPSLIQLLKLFTEDGHRCCFSFTGKGGTGPTSFKTFFLISLFSITASTTASISLNSP